MSVEDLTKLIVPNRAPRHFHPDEWRAVEGRLGTALPRDYKDFVETYGAGCFDDFLWIYGPFSTNRFLNLIDRSVRVLAALTTLRDDPNDRVPFAIFPASGGLLPWGSTNNGDFLCWMTRGHPDRWSMVVAEARAPEYDSFEISTTTFVAGLLAGTIACRILPDDFPRMLHTFRSDAE